MIRVQIRSRERRIQDTDTNWINEQIIRRGAKTGNPCA